MTLDWLPSCSACRTACTATSRTRRRRGRHGARGRAERRPGAARRRRVRARALIGRQGVPLLELELRKVPGRRRVQAPRRPARPRRRVRRRGDDRDDVDELGRPRRRRSPTRARSRGVWLHVDAAYAGSAAVCPSCGRSSPAGSAPTRSSSTRTSGCSCRWTARRSGRGARTTSARAFSLVPEYLRSADDVLEPERVRAAARPPLPRAQALGGAPLLRPRGAAGGDPRARPPARCSRAGCATSPAGRSRRRDRSRSSASAWTPPTRRTRSCSARVNARGEVFLSHTRLRDRFVLRLAIGNARTTEDDVRVAWDVLRREARRL